MREPLISVAVLLSADLLASVLCPPASLPHSAGQTGAIVRAALGPVAAIRAPFSGRAQETENVSCGTGAVAFANAQGFGGAC